MTAGQPILAVERLSVDYATETGPVPAVRDVSFSLARRQALGLVGESGSGKSTIGLAVIRDLPANATISAGAVRFDGADLVPLSGRRLRQVRGQRIAMVYQDPVNALNPSMQIGNQIGEVFRCRGERDPKAVRERVVEMLERVHLPDPAHAHYRYPHEFSGGQQQRIVIAMALAMSPDLLILDEPTTGLDVSVEAESLDLFSELRSSLDAAILFISHNIAVVAKMCDRVGALHEGRLVELGPTSEVLHRPQHPYTRALLAARIPFGRTKPPAFGCERAALTGRTASQQPLVEVQEVSKTYRSSGRGVQAVVRASLSVPAGTVLGLVGESGSGKTTTARIIAGLMVVDEGRVLFEGADINKPAQARSSETRSAIQMVFQNPDSTLNAKHRIVRTLRRAAVKLRGARGPEADQLVRSAMQAVRLESRLLEAFPEELSGGQRQRVAIARAFIGKPRLVLCDEPTSALDVSIQASILKLLVHLQRREGTSYVFISHDLAVVRYVADWIAVMYLGEVVEMGPAGQVFEAPHHPYTETLVAAVRSLEEQGRHGRLGLRGPVPSLLDRPRGCPFHTRCPRNRGAICAEPPPWQDAGGEHRYRCVIPPAELATLQRHASQRKEDHDGSHN